MQLSLKHSDHIQGLSVGVLQTCAFNSGRIRPISHIARCRTNEWLGVQFCDNFPKLQTNIPSRFSKSS